MAILPNKEMLLVVLARSRNGKPDPKNEGNAILKIKNLLY